MRSVLRFAQHSGTIPEVEIKHKALRRFHLSGGLDRKGVPANLAARLARILSRLNVAYKPEELNDLGFRLHMLRGDLAGYWSLRVSGNWRIIFRFRDGEPEGVDESGFAAVNSYGAGPWGSSD